MNNIVYHMDHQIVENGRGGWTGINEAGRRYAAYRSYPGLALHQLNLDFLPYWLTLELISIEYDDINERRIRCWVDMDRNHTPRFRMIPYNRPDEVGKELHSSLKVSITGIGVRHPHVPPNWPLKEVVKLRLLEMDQLINTYGGVGNYGGYLEALAAFNKNM